MKFFIDTANLDEIQSALEMGILDGVTTNPSLVSKEVSGEAAAREHLEKICGMVDGRPVSLEAVSTEYLKMVDEGVELAAVADNAVVKIPMTLDGIRATKTLRDKGIKINMTLVFSPLQALLAAKVGATYVSPFVGRLDDISHNGMELVGQIVNIYQNYGYETEVLVASVRNPLHVLEGALMGAQVATIPFKVISQLVKHPLTDKGLDAFLADWKKVTG